MTSWSFLKVHVEKAPEAGEAAMIISAAQHVLPPGVFVKFARENAHWYTPETLQTIFRCGYWPLGATRAVVATIKELRPKGGRVAYTATTKHAGHDSLFRRGERLRYAQRISDFSVEEHVGRGAVALSPAHRAPKVRPLHLDDGGVVVLAPSTGFVLDERIVVAFGGRKALMHNHRGQLVRQR